MFVIPTGLTHTDIETTGGWLAHPFRLSLLSRLPRPCLCVFCRDRAGNLTFAASPSASGWTPDRRSKSPPCRKRRDKGGATSGSEISGKPGPAPKCESPHHAPTGARRHQSRSGPLSDFFGFLTEADLYASFSFCREPVESRSQAI
jgi:hypothetical protein